jgi:hypothetical protein
MLQIVKTILELEKMKSNLNVVYQNQLQMSFYSPEYVIKAFENFITKDKTNQLYFVVNKSSDVITNYIPLYIDSSDTLRFIFDKHTDYCSCLGPPMDFAALKALSELILQEPKIKRVELDNLLPNDMLLNGLKHFFGIRAIITSYNNYSFVHSTAIAKSLAHLKSNEKSKLKRIQRKNQNCTFEVFANSQVFPWDAFLELKQQMISKGKRNTAFFDNNFVDMIQKLYDVGEIEIFTKSQDGQFVSASIVLVNMHLKTKMVWFDLFSDIQYINLSAYVDYIDYLDQVQGMTLSLGRGSYDYKAKNFQPQIQNLFNLRYSKSKFDFWFANYFCMKYFLKRIVSK